jgi:hypothetical protein
MTARVAPLLQRVVVAMAVVDWALAAGMTATGRRREVAVPLLVAAAGTLVAVRVPALNRLGRRVRLVRAGGASGWDAAESAIAAEWSPRAARLVLREPRLVWSLALLVRGRRDGAPAPVFTAFRDVLPVWLLLLGLAVAEVALTIPLPLPAAVHAVLLAAGVWGVVVVGCVVAAVVVHPHVVTVEVVRLRFGFWQEVRVPRGAVVAVRATRPAPAPRGLHVDGDEATLSPGGAVNVVLELGVPVEVAGAAVTRVRAWADDPRAFAATAGPG